MLIRRGQSPIRAVLTLPAMLCLGLVLFAAVGVGARSPGPFLFSYFLDNGQDGLHLAFSRNGLTWTPLGGGKSYLAPGVGGKLIRDPCIMLGPDKVYHAVWTSGWWDKGIGIAHSRDLIAWSEPEFLPVMTHEPTAANAWAPEILYDGETRQYVIYWSTTIPGRFPHRGPRPVDRAGPVASRPTTRRLSREPPHLDRTLGPDPSGDADLRAHEARGHRRTTTDHGATRPWGG